MVENWIRLKCQKCGEEMARAKNLNRLMENFFKNVARHNMDDMDDQLCGDKAKDKLSMDDLRGAFAGENPEYVFERSVEYQPVGWEETTAVGESSEEA